MKYGVSAVKEEFFSSPLTSLLPVELVQNFQEVLSRHGLHQLVDLILILLSSRRKRVSKSPEARTKATPNFFMISST